MADTIADVQQQAIARLSIAAVPATARQDAVLLLLHVLAISRAALLAHPGQHLTQGQLEAYFQAVERRAQAEPVQYITGMQEFYGLAFHVTPAVLIPRPETEHLVEAALEIAHGSIFPMRILDVGTGSGIIAVTLARHLPAAYVLATDISTQALEIAARNAAAHGVAEQITFLHQDMFPEDAGPFDILCSNPPYVAAGEMLETQVLAFEPHRALFAGPTGLEVYQRLIPRAAAALKSGGTLLLEIGHGQSSAIESLLRASDLQGPHFIPDLQGIPRVAVSHKA